VPEHARGGILFGEGFTFAELTRRFDSGAQLVTISRASDGVTPLFILLPLTRESELHIVRCPRPLVVRRGVVEGEPLWPGPPLAESAM
jgi:hypothetical protein